MGLYLVLVRYYVESLVVRVSVGCLVGVGLGMENLNLGFLFYGLGWFLVAGFIYFIFFLWECLVIGGGGDFVINFFVIFVFIWICFFYKWVIVGFLLAMFLVYDCLRINFMNRLLKW